MHKRYAGSGPLSYSIVSSKEKHQLVHRNAQFGDALQGLQLRGAVLVEDLRDPPQGFRGVLGEGEVVAEEDPGTAPAARARAEVPELLESAHRRDGRDTALPAGNRPSGSRRRTAGARTRTPPRPWRRPRSGSAPRRGRAPAGRRGRSVRRPPAAARRRPPDRRPRSRGASISMLWVTDRLSAIFDHLSLPSAHAGARAPAGHCLLQPGRSLWKRSGRALGGPVDPFVPPGRGAGRRASASLVVRTTDTPQTQHLVSAVALGTTCMLPPVFGETLDAHRTSARSTT